MNRNYWIAIITVAVLAIILVIAGASKSSQFSPAPGTTGKLSVTSNPSSASLYIDGAYRGLTPLTVSNLFVGNHKVNVKKPGYNVYSTTKYVYAGNNSLNVTLTPVTNQTIPGN